jgi:hypothetical protein
VCVSECAQSELQTAGNEITGAFVLGLSLGGAGGLGGGASWVLVTWCRAFFHTKYHQSIEAYSEISLLPKASSGRPIRSVSPQPRAHPVATTGSVRPQRYCSSFTGSRG